MPNFKQLLPNWLMGCLNTPITPTSSDRLSLAISDSLLMITTASEKAIMLDDADILAIIQAKNAENKKGMTAAQETKFWTAFERIADRIKPITIDSIKATYDPSPRHAGFIHLFLPFSRIPLSRRCAETYKIISLITLLLLILVQVYWYIGWSLTTDIQLQSTTITSLQTELLEIRLLNSSNPIKNNEEFDSNDLKKSQIDHLLAEHGYWKEAATKHLQNWNRVWSEMDLLTLQPWQDEDYQTFPIEVQQRIQLVSAENTLQAITEYALPILYGMIGACFFILRQIPKEIAALTFSMNSYISYNLRMVQGPLAGIMTSYFFSSDQITHGTIENAGSAALNAPSLEPGLTALSPLAVAFLAGYSVEFIFRFFDRILANPNEAEKYSTGIRNKVKHVKRATDQK